MRPNKADVLAVVGGLLAAGGLYAIRPALAVSFVGIALLTAGVVLALVESRKR